LTACSALGYGGRTHWFDRFPQAAFAAVDSTTQDGFAVPSFICLCAACPDGVPSQWKVTLSGISNNACANCGSVNGDYILSTGVNCLSPFPKCLPQFACN
jgi:hypothetical protein